VLGDPPSSLPPEPRAFYAALLAAAPAAAGGEVDFGDAGIGLTFAGGVGAQVSRRAAVVFAGTGVEHFDERTPGWTDAAAQALARALSA